MICVALLAVGFWQLVAGSVVLGIAALVLAVVGGACLPVLWKRDPDDAIEDLLDVVFGLFTGWRP